MKLFTPKVKNHLLESTETTTNFTIEQQQKHRQQWMKTIEQLQKHHLTVTRQKPLPEVLKIRGM